MQDAVPRRGAKLWSYFSSISSPQNAILGRIINRIVYYSFIISKLEEMSMILPDLVIIKIFFNC